MKPVGFTFLISVSLAIAASAGPQALEMREVVPKVSEAVLFNPGMGLYLAGGSGLSYQPEPDAWAPAMADIVYFRPGWGDLEADGPGSHFDDYFEPIFDFWVRQRGKRVAFRVMSESMHSKLKYVTPKWVLDQGVPSVTHRGLYVDEQVDPVFWDDRYLDLCCQFVERLGKHLDSREGLEFVDIGSIGEWGEMHLGLHIPGRWTPGQLEETGFTREKYIGAYRRVIDAHAVAFRNTRVFLNVGSYGEINDYAALRGCHFRQDGLTPSGPSANVGDLYFHPYSRRGVVCNYEFHSGYQSMLEKGWDLHETVAQGLGDPISYLNTNILSPKAWEDAPQEVKELFLDAARKVGYRFVPVKVRVPKQLTVVRKPSGPDADAKIRLIVEHNWRNVGIAPCYESFAMEFTLHDTGGKILASQLHYPRTATTRWGPGEEVSESTLIRFPADTPPGEYALKVAMALPEKPGRKILLGIEGRDGDDRYELCRMKAVAGPRPAGIVYEQRFEDEGHAWQMAGGMEGTLDDATFHEGKSSLKLTGTQQGSYSFLSHNLGIPVLPGSKYRLSCWLKVESLEPARKEPYLKIGLVDAEGAFLANQHTGRYDTGRMGEWQQLTGTLETTLDTGGGHLALEKGGNDTAVEIRAWIDQVQLELLESP